MQFRNLLGAAAIALLDAGAQRVATNQAGTIVQSLMGVAA